MLMEVVALPFALARTMRQIMHPQALINPLLTLTDLVALSASQYPLSSHCLPVTVIVVLTPFLLRPLLSPLLLPALVAPSYCQRYDIAPTAVAVTP